MSKDEQFRFEHGKLYEFREDQNAYVFVGAYSGHKAQAIRKYEESTCEESSTEDFDSWWPQ